MGTNYYTDSGVHLGKVSSLGAGKGWVWTSQGSLERIFGHVYAGVGIVDEYGRGVLPEQLANYILSAKRLDEEETEFS